MFCKHKQAKPLYLSKVDAIYYCPDCKKYAKGMVDLNEKERQQLRWRRGSRGLGDISNYLYLGGYD